MTGEISRLYFLFMWEFLTIASNITCRQIFSIFLSNCWLSCTKSVSFFFPQLPYISRIWKDLCFGIPSIFCSTYCRVEKKTHTQTEPKTKPSLIGLAVSRLVKWISSISSWINTLSEPSKNPRIKQYKWQSINQVTGFPIGCFGVH